MTERHITTPDLAEFTGVTYRRLDYWARLGLLEADHVAPGQGNPRTHPAGEVAIVERVDALIRLEADVVFAIARELEYGPVRVGPLLIVDVSEGSP